VTDVWIVLVEERHADVEALPFSTEDGAMAAARGAAMENAVHGDVGWDAGELNDAMRRDGWVLYLPYGTEGDCVRVVKRRMNEVPGDGGEPR